MPPGIGWVLQDLPEERRAQFDEFLQQSAQQLNPARSQMNEAMRRVNELMASPQFNREEVAMAFGELREANSLYQTLSHEETVQLLSQLTEEERQAATAFIQRGGPRGRGQGDREEDRPGERRPPDRRPPD